MDIKWLLLTVVTFSFRETPHDQFAPRQHNQGEKPEKERKKSSLIFFFFFFNLWDEMFRINSNKNARASNIYFQSIVDYF